MRFRFKASHLFKHLKPWPPTVTGPFKIYYHTPVWPALRCSSTFPQAPCVLLHIKHIRLQKPPTYRCTVSNSSLARIDEVHWYRDWKTEQIKTLLYVFYSYPVLDIVVIDKMNDDRLKSSSNAALLLSCNTTGSAILVCTYVFVAWNLVIKIVKAQVIPLSVLFIPHFHN